MSGGHEASCHLLPSETLSLEPILRGKGVNNTILPLKGKKDMYSLLLHCHRKEMADRFGTPSELLLRSRQSLEGISPRAGRALAESMPCYVSSGLNLQRVVVGSRNNESPTQFILMTLSRRSRQPAKRCQGVNFAVYPTEPHGEAWGEPGTAGATNDRITGSVAQPEAIGTRERGKKVNSGVLVLLQVDRCDVSTPRGL
jgi:hypothetical protein